MTLLEVSQIYTDLVLVYDQIPESEQISKDEIGMLRSKYHQLLMDKLCEENIEYGDRYNATNIAFELIKSPNKALPRTSGQVVRN